MECPFARGLRGQGQGDLRATSGEVKRTHLSAAAVQLDILLVALIAKSERRKWREDQFTQSYPRVNSVREDDVVLSQGGAEISLPIAKGRLKVLGGAVGSESFCSEVFGRNVAKIVQDV